MSLQDEKAAALTEILAATGEPVLWKGRTLQALVTDNPLNQELALGGFEAKGNCTIKIPRSAFPDTRPKLGDPIEFNGDPYRITRVTDHPQYPMLVLVAEPQQLTMIDHALDDMLLAYLKPLPQLAGLNGYTGQDNAEHKLPALTVSTTAAEALAGSDAVFKGEVDVIIESEAHDTAPDAHAARVEAVRAALANRATVIAALNATGKLHIYGYAPIGTEPTVGDARFNTKLKYRFGFGPA